METETKKVITVEATIEAPVSLVWKMWNEPQHVMQWNHASDDWHSPRGANDLKVGGKFSFTMAAKDGSMSFDFEGVYDVVEENKKIAYTMSDDRKVTVEFSEEGNKTMVVEKFEAESTNSLEMQKTGWQSILDNFRKYVESNR